MMGMASTKCAYCGAISSMIPVWGYEKRTRQVSANGNRSMIRFDVRVAARCSGCNELSIAIVDKFDKTIDPRAITASSQVAIDNGSPTWQPLSVVAPEFPDVPTHVARCATEAYQAASIGAHIAAILMARTTIEAAAKDRGVTNGTLIDKIDKLVEDQAIRKTIGTAAHAIRHLGNDMAHGDVDDEPAEQDALDILKLMSIVLDEVYQATALADSILARHTKTPAAPPPSSGAY